MTIWSTEIKELEALHNSTRGHFPELEKELEQLIRTEDANVVMLYSRRCLEVIITELCESELKRSRKTEPLKGIIDKLNREEKVPSHIITSMQSLNSMSTYGAHPKEFEPEQVKPVLNNLTTIIKWYLKYKTQQPEVTERTKEEVHQPGKTGVAKEDKPVAKTMNKPVLIVSGLLLAGVIIVLVFDVFNIFHKDKLKDIRDPDGRISIAVMPFRNMTGDSTYNNWQDSFQNLLISNLSNADELSVRQYETMIDIIGSTGHLNYASITPALAKEIASKLESGTLINGSISKAGEKFRINIQLVKTESTEIFKSFMVECKKENEFFNMADSLSKLLKDFLRIEIMKQEISPMLDVIDLTNTTSPDALNYFVQAFKMILAADWNSSAELLLKAIEIDPDYTNGYLCLMLVYSNMGNHEKARDAYLVANENREKMSYRDQLFLDHAKYGYLDKNPQKGIQYLYQLHEMEPQNRFFLNNIGDLNRLMHNYDREIEAYEKYIELDTRWGATRKWIPPYVELGDAYHIKGNHKREQELFNEALEIRPDNPGVIYRQAKCALSQGDIKTADKYISKYLELRRKESWWSEAAGKVYLGNLYSDASIPDEAEQYYRQALDIEPQNPWMMFSLARLLITNDINIDEGLKLVNMALDSRPDNYNYQYIKAIGLYKKGKYEETLGLLNKSWDSRIYYDHEHYLLIKEVEEAVASQKHDE
ncbi:MAG: hypothetical protein AMS27_10685 [Bacteroides sp. SM23_62_1]|nr:MAG: hypothetical protein AMS27_10685 [Bacteroides sp. SM23_62_1]